MCEYENEEWRPVVGWEQLYEVSSLGHVRSVDRTVIRKDGIKQKYRGRNITIKKSDSGYAVVRLYSNRIGTWHFVHKLIAEAFGLDESEVLRIHDSWLFNKSGDIGICLAEDDCNADEEWKDIVGYDKWYQVSSCGRVRSITTTRSLSQKIHILSQYFPRNGSKPHVKLTLDGYCKSLPVDLLVATAYIDRPHNHSFIRHRNGDETDCSVDNLEWATTLVEDVRHADSDEEIWKPVAGWENLYEVSNKGSVRSLDRQVVDCNGKTFLHHGKMLSLRPNNQGYPMVALIRNNEKTYVSAHRLTAIAFIDNPDNLPVVDHINGIRNDNRVENLRWVTASENMRNASAIRDTTSNAYAEQEESSLDDEEWRDITDHDGYQVSSMGRIRSLPRRIRSSKGMRNVPGKVLRTRATESGRMVVSLSRPKKCNLFVDSEVAKAFVPNDCGNEFVVHLNGDNSDSRAENLAWRSLDEIASEHEDDFDWGSEEWADLPGYGDKYRVNRSGQVRATSFIVRCAGHRTVGGRELKPAYDEDGNETVLVDGGGSYGRVDIRVKDLIAAAFATHVDAKRFDRYSESFLKSISRDAEEWRDVKGYQSYFVSNYGRILRRPHLVDTGISPGGIVRQTHTKLGYAYVSISDGVCCKRISVHRIVATAFHENPRNLPAVNHIDENPSNNSEWNLEWCSYDYNNHFGNHIANCVKSHDYVASGLKRRKPVIQFDEDGNVVNRWSGLCEIEDSLGYHGSTISKACRGIDNHKDGIAYGYRWCFEEDYVGKAS